MHNERNLNRVAFIIGGMSKGGAQRVVSIIANHYAKKGKVVDIITLLSSDCTYELDSNVNLISLANDKKNRKLQVIDWVSGLRKYYKEYRPYCIISFFAKVNVIVLLALYRYVGDIVVSERNDPSKDGRGLVVRFLTSVLYPKAKKVVFQTKWAQSCFRKKIVKNSVIIQNPITQISIKEENLEKTKTIINVGKLMDQKNQKLLIISFGQIAEDFPEYNLVIYGEGEKRAELECLINDLGLKDRIKLPGWTNEVHKKIAESELFVLSSNYEGLSNALLEAMTIGIPCISTDCAGSNEIIIDNYNGGLVPTNSIPDLVNKIRFMLENPKKMKEIGKEGQKYAQRFVGTNIIDKWEAIIS